jgi:hypothetical protein
MPLARTVVLRQADTKPERTPYEDLHRQPSPKVAELA